MKKWIPYHPFLADEIERRLEQEEKNGLRLTCVKWGCSFVFEEARPRETRYFFSRYIQEHDEIIRCEYDLKRCYNADPIPTRYTQGAFFRIPKVCDLSRFRLFRNQYFYFRFVLPLLGLGLLALAAATMVILLADDAERIVGFCLFAAAVLFCGYMSWTAIRLRRTILTQSGCRHPRDLFDPNGVILRGTVQGDSTDADEM